jgi:hypothetical protein
MKTNENKRYECKTSNSIKKANEWHVVIASY